MNRSWSFYDAQTGIFLAKHSSCPCKIDVSTITPPGCVAIEGRYDRFTQRVDLATGEVVADDSLAAGRDDQRRRDSALAAIAELERRQLRPLRELAIDQGNETARGILAEIEAEITAARDTLRNDQ